MNNTLIQDYSHLSLHDLMLNSSFSREEKWILFQNRIEILKNRDNREELNNPMTNQTACYLGLKFAQLLYNTFGWRGPSLPTIGASMSNSLECMKFVRSTGSEYGNQYPNELNEAFKKNNIDMILFLIDDGAMLFDTSGFISLFIRYNIHDIRIGLHLLQKNILVGLDILEYLNNLTEYDLYDNNIRNILFNQDLTQYVSIYNIINNLKERRKITYEIMLKYIHKDVIKYILDSYI
jgi:hypothetical protein